MARTPRPSIADQLAAVAATRPRDHVTTRSDEAAPTVPGPSSESSAPILEVTPAPAAERSDAVTSSRGVGSRRGRENDTPDGMKVRQRIEKPHASLYAHPRVFKKIREIAAAQDCKPHDLYVEGLRMVLKTYGYDLDKLEAGE